MAYRCVPEQNGTCHWQGRLSNRSRHMAPCTRQCSMRRRLHAKYLPAGLKSVAQTAGHIFFVDPLRRSYKTAQGYVRPERKFLYLLFCAAPSGYDWSC